MNPALSRRAVACKGWRWMPGMKGTYPAGSVAVRVHGVGVGLDPYCDAFALHSCRRFNVQISRLHDPDLTDAATLGCLLALVREAWGCAVITCPDYDYDDEEARQGLRVVGWRAVETVRWMPISVGATEGEALVAALESAP